MVGTKGRLVDRLGSPPGLVVVWGCLLEMVVCHPVARAWGELLRFVATQDVQMPGERRAWVKWGRAG